MNATTILLSALLMNAAASAPDWVLRDQAYKAFLVDLQGAVRTGNRKAVANLADLPLQVNGPTGVHETYRSAKLVEQNYERIFTPPVRKAILRQHFEELFGNYQGVMIGNGAVWFDH